MRRKAGGATLILFVVLLLCGCSSGKGSRVLQQMPAGAVEVFRYEAMGESGEGITHGPIEVKGGGYFVVEFEQSGGTLKGWG